MKVAITYLIFAVIATAANILSQEVSLHIYTGVYPLFVSILCGTAVGLVIKYYLDKRYIFSFEAKSFSHDSKTFFLYSFMSVFTTFVFWGFEFSFDYLFQDKMMRYLGGAIGLAIGYLIKYQLDKRFVFNS